MWKVVRTLKFHALIEIIREYVRFRGTCNDSRGDSYERRFSSKRASKYNRIIYKLTTNG